MVIRHHEEQRQKEEKAKRDEHAKIRRVASSIAKEVRAFWSSVEKVRADDIQVQPWDLIIGVSDGNENVVKVELAPYSDGWSLAP